MILNQLKTIIEANAVSRIVLYVPDSGARECEVWAYDWDDETVVSSFGNRLITERTRQPKTYTSFDRAYSALRDLGYKREIVIDTALFEPNSLKDSKPQNIKTSINR
jgi:Holliday junction resolvasome RuvABC DNA-binding subunit